MRQLDPQLKPDRISGSDSDLNSSWDTLSAQIVIGRIIHPLKCFCSLSWILDGGQNQMWKDSRNNGRSLLDSPLKKFLFRAKIVS